MFEKNMKFSYLLDVYGSLLDNHSAAIMRAYYEDDLSLSEIAEGESISRQGVRHIIKRSEEQLDHLESKLGLAEHYAKLSHMVDELYNISAGLEDKSPEIYRAIRNIADKLSDKSN